MEQPKRKKGFVPILQKLQNARDIIKQSDLKKSGRNDFSKFDYYTPEQVEALVDKACKETRTIILCNLRADEYGLYQTLVFQCLEEDTEFVEFEMRTKHGEITATNEAQQMGGTDTYSERYIKMKVFQIKDNNLELDSKKGEISELDKVRKELSEIKDIDGLKRYYEQNKTKYNSAEFNKCISDKKVSLEIPIINQNETA